MLWQMASNSPRPHQIPIPPAKKIQSQFMQMTGLDFGVYSVQAGGGDVMVCRMFFVCLFLNHNPLIPIDGHVNPIVYLTIAAEDVHPCTATTYPSSPDYFQDSHTPCHSLLKMVSCSSVVMKSYQHGPEPLPTPCRIHAMKN